MLGRVWEELFFFFSSRVSLPEKRRRKLGATQLIQKALAQPKGPK